MFDRADTTRSGTLCLAELKAALCRADPLLRESAIEEIMAMLDLEATGFVSFEEVRYDKYYLCVYVHVCVYVYAPVLLTCAPPPPQ